MTTVNASSLVLCMFSSKHCKIMPTSFACSHVRTWELMNGFAWNLILGSFLNLVITFQHQLKSSINTGHFVQRSACSKYKVIVSGFRSHGHRTSGLVPWPFTLVQGPWDCGQKPLCIGQMISHLGINDLGWGLMTELSSIDLLTRPKIIQSERM